MTEECINCIHCHKTKERINKDWKYYYVCTLWLDLKETLEPLLMTLGEEANGLCEMYEVKEQNK